VIYNDAPQPLVSFDINDFSTIGEGWIKYEGFFQDDNKHGFGTIYLENGDKFFGNFVNDLVQGKGSYHRANGEVVTGEWNEEKLV